MPSSPFTLYRISYQPFKNEALIQFAEKPFVQSEVLTWHAFVCTYKLCFLFHQNVLDGRSFHEVKDSFALFLSLPFNKYPLRIEHGGFL